MKTFLELVKISLFGFSINTLWNGMSSIILPLIVMSIVLPEEKNSYLGYITITGLLLAIIIQPVAGVISDSTIFKWGQRRPYILLGAILTAIILPFLGLAHTIFLIFLLYCLLQIASNIAHGPWQGLIPDLVPYQQRGKASGIKGLIEIIGALVGIQLSGYLLGSSLALPDRIKLYICLFVLAMFTIVTAVLTILLVKEPAKGIIAKNHLKSKIINTFNINLNKDRTFLIFLISRFLFLMPLLILRTFSLYLLEDYVGVPEPVAATSTLLLITGVFLIAAVYPTGYVVDKFGRKKVIITSGITATLGFILLLFFNSYNGVLVSGALIGLANGMFMSSNWAMATDIVKKDEEARYLGLTNLATGGAGLVAAFAGPIIDFINNICKPPIGYQVILILCSFFCIMSSALILIMKYNYTEYLKKN